MRRNVFGLPGVAVLFLWVCGLDCRAWDYEGHRAVNLLALSALPTNFPAFVKTPKATERIGFLAGEPDRWRNSPDLSLKHANGPDHYIDLEQLNDYGFRPQQLPVFRYDFVAELGVYRKAHPEKFPAIDYARNDDHTRELVGLLPWAIVENYGKLKSGFSYLKTFQQNGGTGDEIANAERNIVYIMGVMGHYVGDAAQPLHTTVHHHGWVGENPNHYTTNRSIHAWIDGGFFSHVGGADVAQLKAKLHSASLVKLNGHDVKPEDMFTAVVDFIVAQQKLVEPLYRLERDGKLSGQGEGRREGQAFLEAQLVKSGQLLADLWYSAYQQAPPDTFLAQQLARRAGR